MTLIWWTLGFVILFPYVVGPILIFCSTRFRMPVEIVPIDGDVQALQPEVRDYFASAQRALTEQGFDMVGVMCLPSTLPNSKTLLAVFANRSTCDGAIATIIEKGGARGTTQIRYVEYIRRFSDQIVVQTNNSPALGSFKARASEQTTRFRSLDDLHRLYGLHKFLIKKHRGAGQPVLRLDSEFKGNVAEYVAHAVMEESLSDQVKAGYMARVASGFRPTLKGAWIMTWIELWPFKAIRRVRADRHAARTIEEFERPSA